MALLPELEPIVATWGEAPGPALGVSVGRLRSAHDAAMQQRFAALVEPGGPVASVRDLQVPVEGGSVRVRAFTPLGTGRFACHLYLHGGGFWAGTVELYDAVCRDLAADAECVVVSVDYRLAPEHPFPTGPEDCYRALCWIGSNADALGIDASRVSVGGFGAGGNLAAVVALMARDRSGPRLALQVLEMPVTDLTRARPSDEADPWGTMTCEDLEAGWRHYVTEADRTHPFASPLLAADLSGLPPALVTTAEHDLRRDEGEAYARRLDDAGVPVQATRWEGHVHGSTMFTRVLASARQYRRELVDALRNAHSRRPA